MKTCSKCGKEKPLDAFPKDKTKKDGRRYSCKECRKAANRSYYQNNAEKLKAKQRERTAKAREIDPNAAREYQRNYRAARKAAEPNWYRDTAIRKRYGITREQYDALLAHQGGVCAGCGASECPSGRSFAVDHDHSHCPGRAGCPECIRGLLCTGCNVTDALAGRPAVNWEEVLRAYHAQEA